MNKSLYLESVEATKKNGILVRPRINQLLESAAEHALVTVNAGTGYGKTQAVASFLEQNGIQHVWLQLTALDNYPLRFWDIFCQAMHAENAELAEKLITMGFPDTLEKSYSFLRLLAGEVYKKGRRVLVLDDFQKITDAAIIQFVETLCFTGIENLTIILISRYPLTLDYSGLQTKGLIATISAADLRFTEAETQDYYTLCGLEFTGAELANIYRSTEGWPLAIYLIGLHHRRGGTIFKDPVDCTIPLLYTLIEQELFSAYPKDIQRIFIRLSVMESVPVGLMQTLSGNLYPDMAVYLRQNMFVVYNAQTGQYYFHRLFRRFLRQKQIALSDDELARTYQSIGDWYRDQSKYLEALIYYGKCENNARCWQLVRTYGCLGFNAELASLCISLIDRFTPEFIEANPLVRVMRAFLLLILGEVEHAYRHNLELLEEYESLPSTNERQEILGEVYLQLAHLSIMKNSYDFAEYYRKAAACLPSGSQLIQRNHFHVGSNSALHLFSTNPGELDRYVDTLRDIMPTAAKVMNGCGTGLDLLAVAERALMRGELEQAEALAEQTVARAEPAGQYDIVFNAILVQLRAGFCKGDVEATFTRLEKMHSYAARMDDQFLLGLDDIAEGWLYAHIQRPERVAGWITSSGVAPRRQVALNVGKEKVLHALCLLQLREYHEVTALLDFMEKCYTTQGLGLMLMHVHIMRALIQYKTGSRVAALSSFEKAYALAHANGIITTFIEYDNDMRTLLEYILSLPAHGMDEGWLHNLHTKTCTYGKRRLQIAREFDRRYMLENRAASHLSPREMEVLAELCKGLTREEIAAHFSISINTVKTTLKNIFAKLGAINRADAIRIAKDNHLIE